MDETSQAIGELQARVEVLETEVRGLREDVRELLAVVNAGKGSVRALFIVGTIATTLGAGVATIVGWFISR